MFFKVLMRDEEIMCLVFEKENCDANISRDTGYFVLRANKEQKITEMFNDSDGSVIQMIDGILILLSLFKAGYDVEFYK